MLNIGEFARLGQVSPRMLRHYDELGLLELVGAKPGISVACYQDEGGTAQEGEIVLLAGFDVGEQDVPDSDRVRIVDLPVVEVAAAIYRGGDAASCPLGRPWSAGSRTAATASSATAASSTTSGTMTTQATMSWSCSSPSLAEPTRPGDGAGLVRKTRALATSRKTTHVGLIPTTPACCSTNLALFELSAPSSDRAARHARRP